MFSKIVSRKIIALNLIPNLKDSNESLLSQRFWDASQINIRCSDCLDCDTWYMWWVSYPKRCWPVTPAWLHKSTSFIADGVKEMFYTVITKNKRTQLYSLCSQLFLLVPQRWFPPFSQCCEITLLAECFPSLKQIRAQPNKIWKIRLRWRCFFQWKSYWMLSCWLNIQ